jgi:hypothetical protein
LRDFLRPSLRCWYAKSGDSSSPGKRDTLPRAGLVGAVALPAPATVSASSPGAGFRTNPLPASPAPAPAASRSEVVGPRTRTRSSAASPQPESLIEGGVASIMPMKLKDIPALLVSAPPLAPGHHAATAIGSAHRSSCGLPLPKVAVISAWNQRYRAGLPRRPPPPEAFRASGRCDLRAGGRSKPLEPRPGP